MNITSEISQKAFQVDTIHILWVWKFIVRLHKKGKLKQLLSEVLELPNKKMYDSNQVLSVSKGLSPCTNQIQINQKVLYN